MAPLKWLVRNRGFVFTVLVPIILGLGLRYVITQQEEANSVLSVHPALQFTRDYVIGGFTLRWANGSLSIWPADEPDRPHSLW